MDNPWAKWSPGTGWTQLRIAETEKYAHVTYFFNGGRESRFPARSRSLIPSPKVATYDLKPEMSALEVADEAVKEIENGQYRLHRAELRQPRHGGPHRRLRGGDEGRGGGRRSALGQVVDALRRRGGAALVTADHGNADQMVDYETGEPHTVPHHATGARASWSPS